MKIKQLLAWLFDFLCILFGTEIIIMYLEPCIISENNILFFKIILEMLFIYLYLTKDIICKNKTLGKRIFKLCIVSKQNNLPIYEHKILILRNLINLVAIFILYILLNLSLIMNVYLFFWIFLIIVIVKKKESFGDYYLNTKVADHKDHGIYDPENMKNKTIKSINVIVCILLYIMIYAYVIIYQPINYYTYDILDFPFFILLFYLIIRLFSKKVSIKRKVWFTLIVLTISGINASLETKLTVAYEKFPTINSAVLYSYPTSDFIKFYEYDNFAFVILQHKYEWYAQVYIVDKSEGKWNRIELENGLSDTAKKDVTNWNPSLISVTVSNDGKNIVLLNNNNYVDVVEISDSYGNTFEKLPNINNGESSFYVTTFNGKINNDYNISINGYKVTLD